MLTMDATPAPVPENIVVFVLAATVVHMKVNICFTSSVVLKKIVHVTDRKGSAEKWSAYICMSVG